MNKKEFLSQLAQALSAFPNEDAEKSLEFYSEMIDDRIEDGMTEEEAVATLGTVDQIVEQISMELPLPKLIKAKMRGNRLKNRWERALLCLGAPLWIPLLIAIAAILAAVYIVVWAVIVCLYAANLCVAAGAVLGIAMTVTYCSSGKIAAGITFAGVALVCAGLAVLLLFGCNWCAKHLLRMSKRGYERFKALFVQRRRK